MQQMRRIEFREVNMENNIQIIYILMILVFLGVAAYFDIRYKRIPLWVQGMGVIFGCIGIIIQGQGLQWANLFALIPGIFLLVLSFVTGESIGYGDGISVLILGGLAGFNNCMWVLCISLIFISMAGIILLAIKRASRKTKLPYIPFLLAAESVWLVGMVL